MRAAGFALIALVACATAPAAPMDRDPPVPLPLLETALAPPRENDGGVQSQALAFLGREDLAAFRERTTCAAASSLDPVAEIVRQSARRRIVMLNEAHDSPQSRDFIARVAAAMRAEEFSVYAAETFLPSISTERTWPALSDGWYSREPMYGQLLRKARVAGWRFAAYEDMAPPDETASMEERIARREARQAENLQAILAANADARIFIHVGYGHLLERPTEGGHVMMAQRLAEATGIDPLTIDQTRYAAPSSDYVVCDPAQTPSRSVDIRLGEPQLDFADGRPAWRQRAGQRAVAVPPSLITDAQNTIVEARITTEPNDAVPVDRVLLRPGETLPLLLAPGRYRVESWTQERGYSSAVEINVD
jgi:hypothetical protein